jgi:hypothetical protein
MFFTKTPSNNLNMVKMNSKEEELAKLYWFLKRPKLVLGGQGLS